MEGEEEPPHTSPSTMSMPYGSANGRIVWLQPPGRMLFDLACTYTEKQ